MNRRFSILSVSLGLHLCLTICCAEPEDQKLKELQGRWHLVEGRSIDRLDPQQKVRVERYESPEVELSFYGGKIGIFRRLEKGRIFNKPGPFAIEVDPSTAPMRCDYISYPIQPGNPKVLGVGICKVEGDTLYIAVANTPDDKVRPKNFEPVLFPNGIEVGIAVFKRVKMMP